MTPAEFREARLRLGLRQLELADIMGMTPQAVSRIECGDREPTRQHAAFLAYMEKHPPTRAERRETALRLASRREKSVSEN